MPTPRLLDQAPERMRLKHYSLRTEEAYLHWVRRFILYHGKRHPRDLGAAEVEAFLSHLATEGRVSASTQNQALAALLFLYREVLGVELPWMEGIVRAKRPARLPVVLTETEVRALLAQLDGTRWLAVSLLYSSGMRLLEGLRLRVKDVDFERREITVRDGKGARDRRTMLSERLIEPLRSHLARVRVLHERDLSEGFGDVYLPFALARKYPKAGRSWPWQYVFPAGSRSTDPRGGAVRRHHLDEKVVQRAVARAAARAGIDQTGLAAHTEAQLRDPPARGRLRHTHGPGAPRAQGRFHDDDLHARAQQGRPGRGKPARPDRAASRGISATWRSTRGCSRTTYMMKPPLLSA